MKKTVLIDGNSLFNRAFYATPVFTTRNGVPTNAIFGFVKLLFKILQDEKPDYLVVAFDMKAPTFRHKMYDSYKSTRKPMPEDLAVQVEPLKNLLKAMKVAICEKEGIEADDIIGTLSKKFNAHSYIYTGDRDSYQLVDEKTDVCFTKRGVSDILHLNLQNFKEETGLTPSQIIDLKSLMGDKSDNIPGVAGIGEKTALDLLARYENLDGVYAHIEELKGATREKIANDKEMAYLSYKLATIDRNCNLDLDLENCAAPKKFSAEVKKLFADFEFRSLLTLNVFEVETEKSASTEIIYPEVVKCTGYPEIADVIAKNSEFSVVLTQSSAEIYMAGKQYSLTVAENLLASDGVDYDGFITVLKAIYSNQKNKVLAYDFKEQMHDLDGLGVEIACDFEDLSLVKYLCEYDASITNLKELCGAYLYDFAFAPFAISQLFSNFYAKLKSENMLSLYEEIEKPLVKTLFGMEREGVKISLDGLEELSKHYQELIEEYKNKVFKACGKEFNLNSPMQLGEVLYGLGITEIKKKKTGKFTTGADVLEKLADKYPVVSDVLKFRLYQKLNSTYVEGFRPLINKTSGVVHTTYRQSVTATGRLSSTNPNLQNIPVRKDEGKELRKVFVPRDGNVFIDADYSQIELRLLAHFSGCKELLKAYNDGTDIHAITASQVFGVPLESVTEDMRRAAKAVNFGIIYGISDFGLSRDLNIPVSTAREYIENYFKTYTAVKEYMNSNVEFAKSNGFVATLTGRKRVIPEITSSNYNLRQFGERAAMNMPLQGSSADIIKIAMINVDKALKEKGLKTKLILQVHDELVLEAPECEVEEASAILKREMENAVKLNVPLTVEVHTGKNWYEAK